jgi:hypothetical protein
LLDLAADEGRVLGHGHSAHRAGIRSRGQGTDGGSS